MIFLALTVAWIGEVIAGLLFFMLFLVLVRAFVDFFQSGYSPMAGV